MSEDYNCHCWDKCPCDEKFKSLRTALAESERKREKALVQVKIYEEKFGTDYGEAAEIRMTSLQAKLAESEKRNDFLDLENSWLPQAEETIKSQRAKLALCKSALEDLYKWAYDMDAKHGNKQHSQNIVVPKEISGANESLKAIADIDNAGIFIKNSCTPPTEEE